MTSRSQGRSGSKLGWAGSQNLCKRLCAIILWRKLCQSTCQHLKLAARARQAHAQRALCKHLVPTVSIHQPRVLHLPGSRAAHLHLPVSLCHLLLSRYGFCHKILVMASSRQYQKDPPAPSTNRRGCKREKCLWVVYRKPSTRMDCITCSAKPER